jgi:septal ring factor EnvC (AmiA/AmiB activator)
MLEQRLSRLQQQYRAADNTIKQLNKQIEDFITAKSRHEEQLMTNFTQVLNQKKLKIRNQQRLLASAKIDVDDGKVACLS